MTSLMHWDPFAELRSTMDRLFEEGFSRPWRMIPTPEYHATFPVEVAETTDAVEIKALLPGVRPDDAEISVAGDTLSIKAEHHSGDEEGRTFYKREIPYGAYSRSFSLPVSVDADKAEARYEHGVLHLVLPKAEAARPKQIKILGRDAVAQLT